MTRVEITVGSICALPAAEDFDGSLDRYGCADGAASYAVLRRIMDYGYDHPGTCVTLVCANEAVARAYRFQWNMWFAERKSD